jgi:hypothetical protein
MKRHKILFAALLVIAGILLVGLAALWCMFGEKLAAAMSIQKLQDGLYSVEYRGDYGFDSYLAQGGADSSGKMAEYIASFLSSGFWKPDTAEFEATDFGCSTLAVSSPDGTALFGRNYDWGECTAMIVHTVPANGYESVSTCCLNFLGFGDDWKPEGMENQFMALAAVYVPLDGMNEKGLCIADLVAGDKVETHQKTDKPDLTTTAAIRLILDHAATVDEAIELLRRYDMNSDIGTAHHYAISDASGKSVAVEYVGDEMKVTDTTVVTNFYLTQGTKYGIGSEQSHIRYDRLTALYAQVGGVMTEEQVRDALASVAQGTFPGSDEDTEWSLVYNTGTLSAAFYRDEDYTRPYVLTLKSKGPWLKTPD